MLKIYNGKEFVDRICNIDEIYLFGAGKKIKDVEKYFAGTEVPMKVSGIIDNDVKKQGTAVELWGRKFRIDNLKALVENCPAGKLILVTIDDYGDLLDDLLKNQSLKECEIVCFYYIMALQKESKSINKSMPETIRLEEKAMIPKKLHYCWFGGKEMPDKYKRYMESWYKFCPDYEIIEWNESNYDVTKCKYMQEAYERKVWGFVPDYARIDIVYNHGGIYLDTDVELIKSLDDLLYQKGFACFEDESYVNLGSGFGGVKGLPVLKAMRDYYHGKSFMNKEGELDLTGSPVHNTSVLVKYGLIDNGEYQRVEDMTIYPAKVLVGKCMYTMRTVIKPWTYAIHQYDGSWATEKARRTNARMERDMKTYHSN